MTAADWIVIPLARSAGRKSVTVEPSSTSGFESDHGLMKRFEMKKQTAVDNLFPAQSKGECEDHTTNLLFFE